MCRQITLFIAVLLVLSISGVHYAQETDDQDRQPARTFGVISGRAINSATTSNIGAAGISRLSQILLNLGASVQTIPPNEPIPDDIEAVLLIGPARAFTIQQTAYLWDFVANGGHLLLVLDPNGHNGVNSETAARSGFNRLLYAEYGLSIADDFLIEPWFTIETLADVVSSWSQAQAINAPDVHPIIAPLVEHGLPVRFWGGRSLLVDQLTVVADVHPLLFTESPHGETGRVNLRSDDPTQIELNIGQDRQGQLLLAGIAERHDSGSRIALVGDSEIFRNIFGQTRRIDNDALPIFVGNDIFVRRLMAWLMGLPEESWPSLSDSFTWVTIDGDDDDWPQNIPPVNVSAAEDVRVELDQYRAFRNDYYVYLLLQTQGEIGDDVTITFDITGDETPIEISREGAVFYDEALVTDATAAFGQFVEMRLPRRLFGMDNRAINRVCFLLPDDQQPDCYELTINPTISSQLDPLPVRGASGPQAFSDGSVNIRAAPAIDAPVVASVPTRTQFSLLGRDEAGEWLYVRNGRYEGWMAEFVLVVNADVQSLPLID